MRLTDLKLHQVIEVPVIKEDIERGVPEHCEQCPVALALLRMFTGEPEMFLEVGPRIAYLWNDPYGIRVQLEFEPTLKAQIRSFDDGFSMQAGTYSAAVIDVEPIPLGV